VVFLSLQVPIIKAQSTSEGITGQLGDKMIHAWLSEKSADLHETFLKKIDSKEDWLEQKPRFKEEYLYMLGLSPMPEKTPLKATVTGSLEGDGYVIDMLHYQSSPGLYVTGNLYRPAAEKSGEKLPTILYVCGHAQRGRDGNKTAYQSHGIWFARHGYICLMVDTIQRGEIKGVHHGTYSHNRWWWHSRGYTPAGVETWNGIRGIDYLISRPDVDPERIGVTGISGGGSVSFWVAGADERVKVASPVSGTADLPGYIPNKIIDEHCDCMFLYNTYQWPWHRIGALIAPRPLLFVNSDRDAIFPMPANERVINRLETVYSLFGAGDHVDSLVSMGGHAYREDIRKASFRFMNIYFKNDPSPVLDSEIDLVTGSRGQEVHPIPPEKLRVFPNDSDLPGYELNSAIDRHFVPMAKLEVPTPGSFIPWKEKLLKELRQVTFRSFPKRIPTAIEKGTSSDKSIVLETESGIAVGLHKIKESTSIERIPLVINSGNIDIEKLSKYGSDTDVVYVCDPRGIGATRWAVKNPPNFVARSHPLVGRTVDDGRIWDIAATARYLMETYEGKLPLHISGVGAGAVLGAYAMLLEPDISGATFESPSKSHMDESCPPLLNVLRVCDVPDVLGALAPRPVTISGWDPIEGEKVVRIYSATHSANQLNLITRK